MIKKTLFALCWVLIPPLFGQQIPDDRVLAVDALGALLKPEVQTQLTQDGQLSNAQLATYFRTAFSERFFYTHSSFANRLKHYNSLYSNQEKHRSRGLDHLGKYTATTQWVLPFNYQNGEAVNAYALRHLARQHKMVDIAFMYFNEDKDPKYIQYFENQMRSLNTALVSGSYEKIEDGNGVYEVFRAGYRVLNWLWIHNMFLNEAEYGDTDQLTTIATLLQHGQHLYERNSEFKSGNHQTRGMSALAMLAILLRDFEGTDLWYQRAMQRLGEHLEQEINPDGFQFERSVHYHMSDINNYYYVYQLAKQSGIVVDKAWEEKLKNLFATLVKVAYPDKSAPVLQDDTDNPWAEKNDISGVMTLGYLLFENPEFGYFATDKVAERMYWFLSDEQVALLQNIAQKKPAYGSLSFEDTHYYIMRQGWNANDKMLIVSAGLDDKKPDHQHADMLGVQAMANGQTMLPNYQVRYSLKDFDFFKNSMVKNVALVDKELQGKQWTSNKGGSGFGKFKELPNPKVISWERTKAYDLFVGSHDGFDNIDVAYTRQVIYIKDDFWIVKDNFTAPAVHTYKQVWQGHYTTELGPNLLRATFPDASGLDILQLQPIDTAASNGRRGKSWTVVSKGGQKNFSFITALFPYKGYDNRIEEGTKEIYLGSWVGNVSDWECANPNAVSLSNGNADYFFGVTALKLADMHIEISDTTDLYVERSPKGVTLHLLGTANRTVTLWKGKKKKNTLVTKELKPGAILEYAY